MESQANQTETPSSQPTPSSAHRSDRPQLRDDPAAPWRSLLGAGDIVLDIGAGAGTRSLVLAEAVGDDGVVHAVEGDPACWSALEATAARAPRRNIVVHPFGAASDGEGLRPSGGSVALEYVRSIDSLSLPGVDLILFGEAAIGADARAQALVDGLRGALTTIAKTRSAIFCPGAAASGPALDAFARDFAYRAVTLPPDDLVLTPAERAPQLLRRLAAEGHAAQIIGAPVVCDAGARRPLLIAVAFYKAPELVGFIATGLERIAAELRRNDCRILFYNDSPDHAELSAAFDAAAPRLAALGGVELIANPQNLGFIATMNQAFAEAERDGRDLLLLNSDAMPAPGALDEMRFVAAQDPMIGFVCPRSNNATLATIGEPVVIDFDEAPRRRALERQMGGAARFLPRAQYVPTNVGFCMLIKHEIIAEFGALSPVYGQGYNEENDYVMRAGQCGFRAALANWAYAFHVGEKSFAQSEAQRRARDLANRDILVRRYPEYPRLEANYFASENYAAEAFLTRLAETRVRFAIDATALFVGHNGTQILIATLIREIERLYGATFDLALIGDPQALAFHGLDRLARARPTTAEDDELFDLILRIGQPFDARAPEFMARRAPVNIYFMLDTIALDCAQLYSPQLDALWTYVMSSADGVIYNSAFTQQQFRARFAIDHDVTAELVSHHSLKTSEYAFAHAAPSPRRQPHVLIVGNHFPHKDVAPTYDALSRRVPERKYVALGAETRNIQRDNQIVDELHTSGQLSNALIADLYLNAEFIVFPSYYEGFGFPIETALAAQKPVLARATPVNREIAALLGSPNLHLYRDRDELVELVRAGLAWRDETPPANAHDWSASAREIVEFCLKRLNACSAARVKSRRKNLRALRAELAPPPVAPEAMRPPEAAQEPDAAPILSEPPPPSDDRPLVATEDEARARRILLKSLRSFILAQRLKRFAVIWSAKRRRRYRAALREAKALRARIEAGGLRLPPG